MCSKTATPRYISACSDDISGLKKALHEADAVLIGAGAGLSAAAGLTYSGERFRRLFPDFIRAYGITDMYSGGFYPFPTPEERWAWWSRHVWHNRYEPGPLPLYEQLLSLVQGRDCFVLTSNVDHQFRLAGFEKQRLFYMQGDYGLWQCSVPCHESTYENKEAVLAMLKAQKNMRIPSELVPRCPRCGAPMSMNLRCDDTFVEDEGWFAANERYRAFVREHRDCRLLLLELGVGYNTPGIIKYPFWEMARKNPLATYAALNLDTPCIPRELSGRSFWIRRDIGESISALLAPEA
ncbi:hypothetical protein [Mailhella massiliensis]|uniref:Deacetylase sirtuin-type domain-containing protein n=1 Tax=Mailhella massiliensis TaxID=1903261 RepID=A0A921AYQ6_9BACT|nr:hypothetical protein [Mailhella massiliensis]HJD98339.1 hypothetical protein [Mailhella massiliensis]